MRGIRSFLYLSARAFSGTLAFLGAMAVSDALAQNGSFPAVGERIPEVAALSETGRVIKLRELEGEIKVLVFGCLT